MLGASKSNLFGPPVPKLTLMFPVTPFTVKEVNVGVDGPGLSWNNVPSLLVIVRSYVQADLISIECWEVSPNKERFPPVQLHLDDAAEHPPRFEGFDSQKLRADFAPLFFFGFVRQNMVQSPV